MPIHDWTRVDAGIFHDFHLDWIFTLKGALNQGLLPADYYALAEQVSARTSWLSSARPKALRHLSPTVIQCRHRLAAELP